MPQTLTQWLSLWYSALASRYGVVIAVSDAPAAKQLLYKARSGSGDEALMGLSIRQSPENASELWLVKGTPNG